MVALITLLGLAGCGNDKSLVTFLNFGDQSFDSSSVNGKVCENDRFGLYWDNSLKRVSFLDKKSGAVWGQIPAEAQNGVIENGVKKKNHPQLESALQVNYQDPKSFDEITLYSYTGAVQEGEIYTEKIDNGLKVIYEFTEFDIAVPVEYTIGEDSFAVTVDPKCISEGEDYKVTSVALEPFLCGLKNNSKNSFLFFPDGSGAIVEPVGEQAVETSAPRRFTAVIRLTENSVRLQPQNKLKCRFLPLKRVTVQCLGLSRRERRLRV